MSRVPNAIDGWMSRIGTHHDIHQGLITSDRYNLVLMKTGSRNSEVNIMLSSLHYIHEQLGSVTNSHFIVQAALFADGYLGMNGRADSNLNNNACGNTKKSKCNCYSHLFLQRRISKRESNDRNTPQLG